MVWSGASRYSYVTGVPKLLIISNTYCHPNRDRAFSILHPPTPNFQNSPCGNYLTYSVIIPKRDMPRYLLSPDQSIASCRIASWSLNVMDKSASYLLPGPPSPSVPSFGLLVLLVAAYHGLELAGLQPRNQGNQHSRSSTKVPTTSGGVWLARSKS